MGAVRIRLRSDLRAGWQAWVALALLLGVVGGAVLLTAAGARRTDTAYARMLRATRAADVVVSPQGTGFTGFYAALSRLPVVEVLGIDVGIAAFPEGPAAHPIFADTAGDDAFLRAVERPKLLEGRMFDPARPDEAVADRNVARQGPSPGGPQ